MVRVGSKYGGTDGALLEKALQKPSCELFNNFYRQLQNSDFATSFFSNFGSFTNLNLTDETEPQRFHPAIAVS